MDSWAIVLAGGRGERIAADVNKVYLTVAGRDLLQYSVDTFSRSGRVDGLVVVARVDDVARTETLVSPLDLPVRIVAGGSTRHQSEALGLAALAPEILDGSIAWVGVHDGARPFADLDLLEALFVTAQERGGAVPGLSVDPPIYRRSGDTAVPVNPANLMRMQTPQVFSAPELLEAFRAADRSGFEGVDTAETVERFSSVTVGIVPGDERNLKVTFPSDMEMASRLAGSFRNGRWVG